MELWKRLNTSPRLWVGLYKHHGLHFDAHQIVSRCPASLDSEIAGGCAATLSMSSQELINHLSTVHRLGVDHTDNSQSKKVIEDEEENPKMTAQGKRRILEPISVNQPLMNLLRGFKT